MNDQSLEVARRFANVRPGMTLLDCEPIGLPYYWTTVDALILERKPTPVIEEFVLETIHAGLGTTADIADFLGIDQAIVDDAAAIQYQADSLDYLVDGKGGRRLALTMAGRRLRETLTMVSPRRLEIPVAFDRVLWRLDDTRKPDLHRTQDVRREGLRLVDPRTARKPNASELRVEELAAALRRITSRDRLSADVLRVITVVRAEIRYRLGHLLLFQPDGGTGIELMVAVDGRHSPAHTETLNKLGGVKFLGIEPTAGTVEASELPSLPPDLEADRVPLAEVRRIQTRIADATRRIEQAASGPTDAHDPTGALSREAHEQARADLQSEQSHLDAIDVREVETYEMKSLLNEALKQSHRRLLIVTPFISANVVNNAFIDDLRELLRKGAVIHIGLGISKKPLENRRDQEALEKLQRLSKQHHRMVVGWIGNTHAKVLISDDVIVTGSFNWLSFKADRRRTYRQELGTLVRRPDYVQSRYDQRRQEIEAAALRIQPADAAGPQ